MTSIVKVSFIFAMGVALTWFMDTAEPKDIIAATAAYAAVLVIFVGTGGTTGG